MFILLNHFSDGYLVKAAAFVAIMFFAGARLIPWLLEHIAHTRSRELFILAILAITLGTAMGASEIFGVSLALGAFVAGAIISQSRLSHQVGADVFSFREAFSVLFFVSVGMLIDPRMLGEQFFHLVGVLAIVLVAKAVAAIVLVRLLGGALSVGLTVAAGLSQVGEFSFILAETGFGLGIFPDEGRDLVLGAALISITLNPLLFALARRFLRSREPAASMAPVATRAAAES